MKRTHTLVFSLLTLTALFSGCAVQPLTPRSENPAVTELMAVAEAETSAGRVPQAIAALERALRIEPKNPLLWHELAGLHLHRGDYRQAEQFAARANSWAGSDRPLIAANWRIIGAAREQLGNPEGARAAFERAERLGGF